MGDVAVDDLQFTGCNQPSPPSVCALNKFRCASGHCVDLTGKCDFVPDCCDGSDESNSTCASYNRYSQTKSSNIMLKMSKSGLPLI